MSVHFVHSEIEFTSNNPSDLDKDFDAFADHIEDALIALADSDLRLVDPSFVGSLRDRRMEVLMGVDAGSGQEAAQIFSAAVRTALHEAECATPGWPTFRPTEELTAELVTT